MLKQSRKRLIALFFLVIFGFDLLYPVTALALTSGPSQPEMSKFEPAGATNLVTLFSGDLNYNLPLLDVGGYPVNLSYQSGTGMEEEASWVGLGWTLNPGSVSRTMRGLPDDFDGSDPDYPDKVKKEHYQKEFKKVGGSIVLKPELFSWETGSASLRLSVYKDNYYGMGASIGAGVGFTLAKAGSTSLTAGLNITSDNRDGVSLSPNLSVAIANQDRSDNDYVSASLSGGLTYNSRAGLKDFSLSQSFSTQQKYKTDRSSITLSDRSAVHYFGQSYTPSVNVQKVNSGFTFNFDAGPSILVGYAGFGGSGYTFKERIIEPVTSTPAFGYLNYLKGRDKDDVLLDFNREKDGVFLPKAPAIATPVATNDFFMVTGQAGSNQFRPYFSGNYIVGDKRFSSRSNNTSVGITGGFGINSFQGGGRFEKVNGETRTGKWLVNNSYMNTAQYQMPGLPDDEPVALKRVGEKTIFDNTFFNKIGASSTNKVDIGVAGSGNTGAARASAVLESRTGVPSLPVSGSLRKEQREIKNHVLNFLNASDAFKYGLEKTIKSYSPGSLSFIDMDRTVTGGYRKAHHISEVSVTDDEGKRMVYGIPVYNTEQQEMTFAVNPPSSQVALGQARRTGLIAYTGDPATNHNYGRDQLYTNTTVPGYATSFLLTGILSPDYVDLTNNGITDDDPGTAVKFNYTRTSSTYKWRAPFQSQMANYNEGFLSDPKDDKGSIVYGEKELWYLHSIESKTMVAFFELSDREDGLGVSGRNGGKNSSIRQKKLDKIKLYSKAEWNKNPGTAVPIKVVHFVYDYSVYPDVPNNAGGTVPGVVEGNIVNLNAMKGKLTLKKVFFTFGSSSRGESNPYEFGYDMRMIKDIPNLPLNPNTDEVNDEYAERQTDRWGTYKQSWYNPGNNGVFNNSEFPYTVQASGGTAYNQKELADRLCSKWQLNKVTTPTGSIIDVEYESDDYAFVQNRRAMQMFMVTGFLPEAAGGNKGLIDADKIVVKLPKPLYGGASAFIRQYLTEADGIVMKKMFFKAFVDLNNAKRNEFVNGYADIDIQVLNNSTIANGAETVAIPIKKIDGNNPISKAAWQMLYADLPQYAYDNYDNTDVGDGAGAIRAIISALGNLGELRRSPDERAKGKRFASVMDPSKSMVRLYNPDQIKLGGGSRVKKVTISDEWDAMAGVGNPKSVTGQRYTYRTKNSNGEEISSGVASYEPAAGNEENPFHEPVSYTEKVQWSSDRYHFIEKPFCETYFPAPSVGYSHVRITSFGNGDGELDAPVGYTENEFYTARDFPVIVDNLPIETLNIKNSLILKLFAARSITKTAVSQGFKVELNDMHGKEKSVKVYNKGGGLISSSSFYYSVKNEKAVFKELKNEVPVLKENGDIQNNTAIGVDVDFVTDMRESLAETTGESIGAYFGAVFFFFFTLPHGAAMVNKSETIDHFHASSAVKVIHRYGILAKTVVTQNGSTFEAENLLWDGQTGEVLLTRTQNEYDKDIYTFNYPAYQGFEGMGAAYKNNQMRLYLQTSVNGTITAGGPQPVLPYLFPGDQLWASASEQRGWVIKDANGVFRLIDDTGQFIQASAESWTVIRSGRRNMLNAGGGAVVTLKDPRVNDKIDMAANKAILDAKAVAYKDWWEVPVNQKWGVDTEVKCITVYPVISPSSAGNYAVYDRAPTNASNTTIDCRGAFFMAKIERYQDPGDPVVYTKKWRSFVDFGNVLPAGSDIQVVSASLSLYGSTTTGANESWLERVTSFVNCDDNVNWTNQPATTTTNRVTLAQSVSSAQNYTNINVTSMFTDWHTLRDLSLFRVAIKLKDETYGTADKIMSFDGIDQTFPVVLKNKPALTVCYIDNRPTCLDPLNKKINPYFEGILGNWRPYINYVYTVDRVQVPGSQTQQNGTDIRNSGYYKEFTPFWAWNNGKMERTFADGETGPLAKDPPNSPIAYTNPLSRWVWSNKSVFYDQKGNEMESVDALNRYSAALFGYRQSLATATGVNSRRREIAFDGFEDYGFTLPVNPPVACELQRHLDFGLTKQGSVWQSSGGQITDQVSHTGKYSFHLTGTLSVTKQAGPDVASLYPLGFDASNRYVLLSNSASSGFEPVPGKKYLLSFWVNDHDEYAATNKVTGLTVRINGTDMNAGNIIVPRVEGWKRLDIPFTAGTDFSLEITGNNKEIDDVRFLPVDGQLVSYVYDDATLRLMAQLDENNFATLYEYDEEGTPIRVKKETERGVMTLKENRQFLRKRN